MSSPPTGERPGDNAGPEPNWYPDPSIPEYIRYWDGSAWMSGTSRPEPRAGEPAPTPPQGFPAVSGSTAPGGSTASDVGTESDAATASDAVPTPTDTGEEKPPVPGTATGTSIPVPGPEAANETGPIFFDEDPPELRGSSAEQRSDAEQLSPQAASPPILPELRSRDTADAPSWSPDEDVSSSPAAAFRGALQPFGQPDPRMPFRRDGGDSTDAATSDPAQGQKTPRHDKTIGIRQVRASGPEARDDGPTDPVQDPAQSEHGTPVGSAGPSMQGRPVPSQQDGTATPGPSGAVDAGGFAQSEYPSSVPPQHGGGVGYPAAGYPTAEQQEPVQQGYGYPSAVPQQPGDGAGQQVPGQPGYGYPSPVPRQGGEAGQPGSVPSGYGYPSAVPQQPGEGAGQQVPGQPGYGYPPAVPQQEPAYVSPAASPAQPLPGPEAQQAAAPPDGVLGAPQMNPLTEVGLAVPALAPWETGGGQAYPAGLFRRFAARFLDMLLPLAGAAAVAFLLLDSARDHIRERVAEVEYAGVDQTIWLVDGTTGLYLAAVVGTFLLLGLLVEGLPTALWGRTPGKAACGVRVVDLTGQEKPPVKAALIRWLTHSLMALLLVGLINALWCLWDRPWRQCLHDKAVGTYVADSSAKNANRTVVPSLS